MNAPVVFIIFNRPDVAERVFARIRRAQPSQLLVVADGPRPGHAGEAEKCAASRALIEGVDWDCQVLKNYSDENMGCRRRIVTGMSWAFDQVEQAIILEDDCLPEPTFFRFCEELLLKYRTDERVMTVCGDNYLLGRKRMPYSYFFHYIAGGWGWATWRRAWQYLDMELKLWPMLRETSWLTDILVDARAVKYWRNIFDWVYEGGEKIDAWDYQWIFAIWAQHGLAATAAMNLISNLGCGDDATHTRSADSVLANIATGSMEFPLRHPPYMFSDREADKLIFENIYLPEMRAGASYPYRLLQRIIP
ncbi:MAG TPA: hypothetical protein VF553_22335 [Pyrinomonadaceae bacterium]|jgi:hypothetical protein